MIVRKTDISRNIFHEMVCRLALSDHGRKQNILRNKIPQVVYKKTE
jgi:hypothetical protein